MGHVGLRQGGEYNYFDRETATANAPGKNLPHWRQPGVIYFVTFRMGDSLPAPLMAAWLKERDEWLSAHPEPHDSATQREYHERFTERMHRYLDEGHGSCPMRQPEVREDIVRVLTRFDGDEDGYALDAFVIMPNHVHALVSPRGIAELSKICHVWKRISAHYLNRRMQTRGPVWQTESWDHIVRSAAHLDRYRQYIVENPARLPRLG